MACELMAGLHHSADARVKTVRVGGVCPRLIDPIPTHSYKVRPGCDSFHSGRPGGRSPAANSVISRMAGIGSPTESPPMA